MPMPQNLTRAQEEAQRYVDETGIDRIVTKMMNAIISEKPDDPKLFMMKYLSERLTDDELELAGIKRGNDDGPGNLEKREKLLEKLKTRT